MATLGATWVQTSELYFSSKTLFDSYVSVEEEFESILPLELSSKWDGIPAGRVSTTECVNYWVVKYYCWAAMHYKVEQHICEAIW